MLNNPYSPSHTQIIESAQAVWADNKNEDSVINYLSEVASYDYKCPDYCDNWASEFLEDNQEEITGEVI